jgi:hypothetical protein
LVLKSAKSVDAATTACSASLVNITSVVVASVTVQPHTF